MFKIFTGSELRELASTAGFRNRSAHEYLEVKQDIALKTMKRMLVIYPNYFKKIKRVP